MTCNSSMQRTRRRVGMSGYPPPHREPSPDQSISASTPRAASKGAKTVQSESGRPATRSQKQHPSNEAPGQPVISQLKQSTKRKPSQDIHPEASPTKASRMESVSASSDSAIGLGLELDNFNSLPESLFGRCYEGPPSPTPGSQQFQTGDFMNSAMSMPNTPAGHFDFSAFQQQPLSAPALDFSRSFAPQVLHAPRPIRPIPMLRQSAPASSLPLINARGSTPDLPVHKEVSAPPLPSSTTDISTLFPDLAPYTPKGPKRIRKRQPAKGTPQLAMSGNGDKPVHVTRPPNAWILYRSNKIAELKDDPALTGRLQADISKMIGALWRNEKPEVKAHYEGLAETRKAEHAQLHPGKSLTTHIQQSPIVSTDYRFAPQRKGASSNAASPKKPRSPAKSASKRSLAKSTPASSITGSQQQDDTSCFSSQFALDASSDPFSNPTSVSSHQPSLSMQPFSAAYNTNTFSQIPDQTIPCSPGGYSQTFSNFSSPEHTRQYFPISAQPSPLTPMAFPYSYPNTPFALDPMLNQSTISDQLGRSVSSNFSDTSRNGRSTSQSELLQMLQNSGNNSVPPSPARTHNPISGWPEHNLNTSVSGQLPHHMQTIAINDGSDSAGLSGFQWIDDPMPLEAAAMTAVSSSDSYNSNASFFSPAGLDPTYDLADWPNQPQSACAQVSPATTCGPPSGSTPLFGNVPNFFDQGMLYTNDAGQDWITLEGEELKLNEPANGYAYE